MTLPAADDIERAAARIAPYVERTRLIRSDELSRLAGVDVLLKLENEQRTGSFKLRGALNVIASLSDAERAAGVVASSAGNHGLGVAFAAKQFGVKATIFIPSNAPRVKRDGIRALGATVNAEQPDYDAAMVKARQFEQQTSTRFVHPCLGDDLLAGQGTVALEVMSEAPDIATFVVSVGGAGLLGGCAGYLRERAPKVRIIGAQSENTAAMARSWKANRVVEIRNDPTLADGLAGQVDEAALEIGRAALDDIVTVSETDLGRAMLWLLDHHGIKAEGSGAAGVAAILSGRLQLKSKTAIVITGGNVDDSRIQELRDQGPGTRDQGLGTRG
jgi:threonine dehydratase